MMRQFVINMRPVADQPYHYRECGLDDVYLLNGFTLENDPEYGELLSIDAADELHKLISFSVLKQKSRLGPKEIRFMRKQMGATQQELAKKMDVNVQTLARWEKGDSQIGGPADRLMRLCCLMSLVVSSFTVDQVIKSIRSVAEALGTLDTSLPLEAALEEQFEIVDRDPDSWQAKEAA